MRLLLLLFFISSNFISHAQNTIEGKIIAGIDGSALSYVNIGVIGKSIGTVSGRDGTFSLTISKRNDRDTLRVSMVGYKAQDFIVADFRRKIAKDYNLSMEEAISVIQEIAIVDSKMKTKIIGNRSTNRDFSLGFSSDTLGNEMAIKIKTRRRMTLVREFNLSINSNEFDTLRFRLNFYESKSGKPGKAINTKNIIITTALENDVLTVDLREYNISRKKDFFVGIEWIEDLGDGELNFSAAFPAREVYYRSTSHAKWKSIKALGVGMNLKVLQ